MKYYTTKTTPDRDLKPLHADAIVIEIRGQRWRIKAAEGNLVVENLEHMVKAVPRSAWKIELQHQ